MLSANAAPARILFMDLDGTLLNDQKEITPDSRGAIERALAQGRQIVVTSGRPLVSTLRQAERLGLNGAGCYAIAYNGAVIYDCGRRRELFRRALDLADLYALFDEANRRGVYIQTYDSTRVLVEQGRDTAVTRRYCAGIEMDFRVIGDVRRDVSDPPVKALCIDYQSREKTGAMEQWIRRHMAGRVDCFFSSPYYLEIVPVNMNKGGAVKEFCRRLQIPLAEAVAVGDEANDVSMIQAAGIGVAMRNAVPEAKAAADYVTERDNNHDGMAEVIEKFLLAAD